MHADSSRTPPDVSAEQRQPRRVKVAGHKGIYRRPKDGKLEFYYLDETGKVRFKTALSTSLRGAEAERAEYVVKRAKGERLSPYDPVKLGTVAEKWIATRNVSHYTLQGYEGTLRRIILPRLVTARVSTFDVNDVLDFITSMRHDDVTPSMQKHALRILSQVMKFAVRRGYIATNPVQQLERSERPKVRRYERRIVEPEELQAIIEALPGEYGKPRTLDCGECGQPIEKAVHNQRYHPECSPHGYVPDPKRLDADGDPVGRFTPQAHQVLFFLLGFTGLRIHEALGLRWCDLDFKRGYVHVNAQGEPGGSMAGVRRETKTHNADRHVILSPLLADALQSYRATLPNNEDDTFVFRSQRRRNNGYAYMSYASAQQIFRRACDAAGLGDKPNRRAPTLHDLRHTFASLLIANGLDPVFVSRQMGHASPTITLDIYADLFNRKDNEERAFRALADAGKVLTLALPEATEDVIEGHAVAALGTGEPV